MKIIFSGYNIMINYKQINNTIVFIIYDLEKKSNLKKINKFIKNNGETELEKICMLILIFLHFK